MQPISNSQKGFTMFEALIYIALFAVVIGGGVISAYNIFEGQANIKAKAQREMELNFVMRKFDWALSGSEVTEPGPGDPIANSLQVLKDGDVYTFTVGGTDTIALKGKPLTTEQLNITDIWFEHVAGTPNVLNIGIEIDGNFLGTTTRYVRTD